MLVVASRRQKLETVRARFHGALILDVTSRGPEPWVRFSPMYPHGGIPVPFSLGVVAASVEGIWQGLKVFASADTDARKFAVTSMRDLKRTVRRNGAVLGHRRGVDGADLLSYRDARYLIYLPAYRWVLDHRLQPELAELARLRRSQPIVLLDYETNADVDDLTKPLSHAALVVRYLEGTWPAGG